MSSPHGDSASPAVAVVTAVKSLDAAKSRFAAPGDGLREAVPGLVLAMLLDTLAAAAATPGVIGVHVVSPDPAVRAAAEAAGARTVDEPEPGGLNAALTAGARAARAEHGPAVAVLALQADLPGITAAELGAFLAATAARRGFVPDHAGTGTAALYAPPGTQLEPAFGPDSAAAHLSGGAVRHAGPWPGLRTDVDTPQDLAGTGPLGERTTAALAAADRGFTSKTRVRYARMDR
ncbi:MULTISPECIES: 2-phospho-L-lactate guanylyltransferase [Tsukamurella]|uniref:Phosphoenolpyruvate guanylyltransferase n=2 Tax=Tsukamurella TaxID=2060 RepID=A0A5C5RVL9_9ACTN|nr:MULTISPECIES: 2-phospho-L-lactate guanylyltransferase [Tsukamurella]NMD54808.1 2-phospho-L-lactate guanylyltransferase [Tsukamurella columbiensis]TWS27086.1 2-phospho-L-lactate guanylyltransferase [Tsukamurella conjunctivitidis]